MNSSRFMEKYTFIPKVRILEIRSTRDRFHENDKNWGKLRISFKIIQKLVFGSGSIITIIESLIQPFFESHFNNGKKLFLQCYMCLRDSHSWHCNMNQNFVIIFSNGLVVALLSVPIECAWINTWFFSNRIVEISEW